MLFVKSFLAGAAALVAYVLLIAIVLFLKMRTSGRQRADDSGSDAVHRRATGFCGWVLLEFQEKLVGSGGVHARLRDSARVAIATSARSASFTDFESGKAAINSGSRSTKLVPRRYRSTYLPRTPPEKSYSGLIPRAGCLG